MPKFKNGKWDHLSDRPVSLTSFTGKIMEKLTKDSINKELMDGNVINTSYDGFMENRPCQTNPDFIL